MKNFYRGIWFIALILIALSSHAQEFKKGSWQAEILGTWKLDSTKTDHKKLTDWTGKEQETRQYLCFKNDHSFILFSDEDLLVRDTFDLVERNGKRIIYSGINNMEIFSISRNQLGLFIYDPGINKARRQGRVCWYSRSYNAAELPAITGQWTGRNDMGISIFGIKNTNMMELKKDGTISLHINNRPDSGTWKINENDLSIDMQLSTGKYTSYIISKEKLFMQVTNPYRQDQILNFMLDGQLSKYNGVIEVPVLKPKTETHIVDTIPPLTIFRKWQAVKKIHGTDSMDPGKTISLLFLKDMTFTITINNQKTTGNWKINTSVSQLIFTSKDNDILCIYKFMHLATDAYGNNDYGKPELILTTILPGENRIGTYVFQALK